MFFVIHVVTSGWSIDLKASKTIIMYAVAGHSLSESSKDCHPLVIWRKSFLPNLQIHLTAVAVRVGLLYCIYSETAVYFTSHRSNHSEICIHTWMKSDAWLGIIYEDRAEQKKLWKRQKWFLTHFREDWVFLCMVQYLWFFLYLNVSSGCRA